MKIQQKQKTAKVFLQKKELTAIITAISLMSDEEKELTDTHVKVSMRKLLNKMYKELESL